MGFSTVELAVAEEPRHPELSRGGPDAEP